MRRLYLSRKESSLTECGRNSGIAEKSFDFLAVPHAFKIGFGGEAIRVPISKPLAATGE
jgi:hypothetical protein